jgi:methylase of polypeptide subunit release factors
MPGEIDPVVEELLSDADMIVPVGSQLRSKIRVSTLEGLIFLHSAYPTTEVDSVFFGPDSYRFAGLIQSELKFCPAPTGGRLLDIGAGSGVGAIVASTVCPSLRIAMTDINPQALRFARINAEANGVVADTFLCPTPDPIGGEFDVVVANPPFMIDSAKRAYRNGGEMRGAQLSLDMARMALDRLGLRGRLILYTGSAIVDGCDELRSALLHEASARALHLEYRELDPDIFGEELDLSDYQDVERIALVAATITNSASVMR